MPTLPRTWTLVGDDGRPFASAMPGTLGGHRRGRIYGRFDCAAALRAIARGGYVQDRVFFRDEATAIVAGFRPCAVCLPDGYAAWKVGEVEAQRMQLTMMPEDEARTGHPRADRVLNQLAAAWTDFHASYAGLGDEGMLTPGVVGDWSVRDLIAHVTWWDQESIDHLPITLVRGRLPRYSQVYGGIDAFNALQTRAKASLSLDEVRAEADATHERLLQYLLSLNPAEWMGNERFRRRLKLDTWSHYPIHAADIRAWRAAAE
jgi:hypothetical protein